MMCFCSSTDSLRQMRIKGVPKQAAGAKMAPRVSTHAPQEEHRLPHTASEKSHFLAPVITILQQIYWILEIFLSRKVLP